MTTGVVVMAYGTPASRDDIPRYYTDIRRGRPPTADQLAELTARYDAIGGLSPLLRITTEQCATLARDLGPGYRVELGQKHAPPTIEDAVRGLGDAGVTRAVGLVLAPHYSALSVGAYAARAAAADPRVAVTTIRSWHVEPAYLDFLAGQLRDVPDGWEVVFTAHSLPSRIVAEGDPYPAQLRETAAAVADRAGLARWSTAWQSAGRTPEPWLGPDVLDVIRATTAPGIVACPCGFAADHLEVLHDLDVEARRVAGERGVGFARTMPVNTDETVLRALAALVRRQG